jgi:hypothetical protein
MQVKYLDLSLCNSTSLFFTDIIKGGGAEPYVQFLLPLSVNTWFIRSFPVSYLKGCLFKKKVEGGDGSRACRSTWESQLQEPKWGATRKGRFRKQTSNSFDPC